jgi:hypothetical protein
VCLPNVPTSFLVGMQCSVKKRARALVYHPPHPCADLSNTAALTWEKPLFCFVFVLIQTLLEGLKGLCRTNKTQILSSWTKPPFEAPQIHLPPSGQSPMHESRVRGYSASDELAVRMFRFHLIDGRLVLSTILFGAESSPTCARSRLEESKLYIQLRYRA